MLERLAARFREPIVGIVVLTLASGFLLGVLAANVRDSAPDSVATSAGVGESSSGLDGGGGSVGAGEGDGAATPGAGAGSGAAQPGGAPGATTPGAAPAGGATTTANVRGVTDKTIKLGIACIDLSVLKNIPQYDAGDQEAQFKSVLEGWRREGLVPVHGRDIELHFRCFNVLSAEDQRATAVELVQDKKVFAVVAHCCFRDGAEIVAREFRTPLVGVDPVLESGYQRSAPFLFSAGAAMEVESRNFVQWIKEQNLLGKKFGFYYLNDAFQPTMVRVMRAELAKLGNNNSVAFATDNQVGGPNDSLAVQRFAAERVDAVVLMTSANGFTQAAGTQRFKPQYVQADFGLPTVTDTSTVAYDQENFDGAVAMTQQRVGEWRLGPVSKPTQDCQDNYFKYKNERIEGSRNESTWGALLYACDVMNLAFRGLQGAGRDLTPISFVRALETARTEGARYGNLEFSPTKHHGGTSFRTVKWTIDCRCWRIQTPAFRPFYVP